ncbi:xylulokinase [Opitutaceae bacterium TAV4]|nr:xylulokinase [Opitutaceae bacterium TAV4]RRK02269.1 xylulokinase [Opitutaceae bacterium TAV3]
MSVQRLLGIDFGTGGCKVSVIGLDGVPVTSCSEEYPTRHPHPGWAEQNPADWYPALVRCLKRIWDEGRVRPEEIVALSFDGSTHNAVLLDEADRVLRPTIMWTDQRSVAESAWLGEHHGKDIFRIGYQWPTPTWTLPQMLWLHHHEPDVLRRTARILFVKDYVRYQVTGVALTDYIEAQGTLFFDVANHRWSPELCALANIPLRALPELVTPVARAGVVTSRAAQETRLIAGTPVICGSSDSAVEDYAAGAIEPGQCIVKLATAGNVNVMIDRAVPDTRTLTYSHVVPGMWYSVTATNAAATCMRWFRDHFCAGEALQAREQKISTFDLMGELAAASPPGARGVCFHPYLQGERSPYWDASLRASFTGLSLSHTKGDLVRAVMEGVAFSLRDCRRVLDDMNLPVNEIRLIGGGAKDALWAQIVCDVFGVPLVLPQNSDASAGSAMLAGVGIGIFADERSAAARCVRVKGRLTPDPERAAAYSSGFERYRRLHDALAEIYHEPSTNTSKH